MTVNKREYRSDEAKKLLRLAASCMQCIFLPVYRSDWRFIALQCISWHLHVSMEEAIRHNKRQIIIAYCTNSPSFTVILPGMTRNLRSLLVAVQSGLAIYCILYTAVWVVFSIAEMFVTDVVCSCSFACKIPEPLRQTKNGQQSESGS